MCVHVLLILQDPVLAIFFDDDQNFHSTIGKLFLSLPYLHFAFFYIVGIVDNGDFPHRTFILNGVCMHV